MSDGGNSAAAYCSIFCIWSSVRVIDVKGYCVFPGSFISPEKGIVVFFSSGEDTALPTSVFIQIRASHT